MVATGWCSQKHLFFQKIITLVITKLILNIFICLASFHMDHPNKHHQQIRLTKQIFKSSLEEVSQVCCVFEKEPHTDTATILRSVSRLFCRTSHSTPTCPIGFLCLKLPLPPCAVLYLHKVPCALQITPKT